MLATTADIPRDLRQLLRRHEHPVVALIFQVQVVACDVRDSARLEAGEARDAVVLVHDDVARAQLRERAQRTAASAALTSALPIDARAPAALGTAAAQQTVLG